MTFCQKRVLLYGCFLERAINRTNTRSCSLFTPVHWTIFPKFAENQKPCLQSRAPKRKGKITCVWVLRVRVLLNGAYMDLIGLHIPFM